MLEQLRREKSEYIRFQNAAANVDKLRNFCLAFNYVKYQE